MCFLFSSLAQCHDFQLCCCSFVRLTATFFHLQYHPHFVIRILPSAFSHPHFEICTLSSVQSPWRPERDNLSNGWYSLSCHLSITGWQTPNSHSSLPRGSWTSLNFPNIHQVPGSHNWRFCAPCWPSQDQCHCPVPWTLWCQRIATVFRKINYLCKFVSSLADLSTPSPTIVQRQQQAFQQI